MHQVVDALHAGAALHCWSSPSTAVAEISRVLRPGGVFVATTYILDGPVALVPFMRTFRQSIMGIAGEHIFISEGELEDLCKTCGLVFNPHGRFIDETKVVILQNCAVDRCRCLVGLATLENELNGANLIGFLVIRGASGDFNVVKV
ncbi:hypothetical protein V6N13_118414 [Hibiscus sabdariffa]